MEDVRCALGGMPEQESECLRGEMTAHSTALLMLFVMAARSPKLLPAEQKALRVLSRKLLDYLPEPHRTELAQFVGFIDELTPKGATPEEKHT